MIAVADTMSGATRIAATTTGMMIETIIVVTIVVNGMTIDAGTIDIGTIAVITTAPIVIATTTIVMTVTESPGTIGRMVIGPMHGIAARDYLRRTTLRDTSCTTTARIG